MNDKRGNPDKMTIQKKVMGLFNHRNLLLTLCGILALASAPDARLAKVSAEGDLVAEPVKNVDVNWISGYNGNASSGAVMVVTGSTIAIDLSAHSEWLYDDDLVLSAVSNSASASAGIDGHTLKVTIASAGDASIQLKASKSGATTVVDTLLFRSVKIGDTNGDGTVTSADALYITKVVNARTPLSDEEANKLDINRDGVVTSADATLLLSKYVGKSGSQTSAYIVNVKEVNDAPVVTHASIAGILKLGETLTANYGYADPEGDAEQGTTFQWFRGTSPDGSDKTAISNAQGKTYAVTDEDVGDYLFVRIVPGAADGITTGEPVIAAEAAAVPDTTPPEIDGDLFPVGFLAKNAMNENFVMHFNEDVKAGEGKIVLRAKDDDSQIAAYGAYDASNVTFAGHVVTIANPGLADVTAYYIEVEPTAIRDTAGNAYAGIAGSASWSFTTPDTTGPLAVSMDPADEAADAYANADLVLTFNENVKAVPDKNVRIYKADATEAASYAADDSAHVVVNGSKVTIKQSVLRESESYYITIDAGAFADLSDNGYAGLTDPQAWNFAVPDRTSPVLGGTSPLNGAVQVGRNEDFVLTFDEDVVAVPGKTAIIRDASTNGAVAQIAVDDPSLTTVAGATVTLRNPGLDDNASYYIEVPAGAFRDASGNETSAIGGASDWHFATTDTIAPTLASTTPVAGGVSLGGTVDLVMTFDEDVSANSGKRITVRKQNGDDEVAWFSANDTDRVSIVGNRVAISGLRLDDTTDYYVLIDNGAFSDRFGNPFPGIASPADWTFSTPDSRLATAVDLEDFTEANLKASEGAVLMLSVAGDALNDGLTTDDFQLNHAPAGLTLIGVDSAGDGSYILYLDFDGTDITEDVTNFSIAIRGSALASGKPITTGTMTISAEKGPNMTALSPANGSIGADKRGRLAIDYDAPISAVSGKKITIRRKSDDGVVEIIDAGNSAKVNVNGSRVTISPNLLLDQTDYDVDVEQGAFVASSGAAKGVSGRTDWSFKTLEAIPGPYFSDYLDGGDGRIAFTVYNPGMTYNLSNYSVWVYRYLNGSHVVQSYEVPMADGVDQYIVISSIFYDFMDVTTSWYYNQNIDLYNPSQYTLNALVVKDKSGKIIDVLGDPSATTASPFMPAGGTLVRKTQTFGGVSSYHDEQWNSFPKGTYQYFSHHTN